MASFYPTANGNFSNKQGDACQDCPAAAPPGCDSLIDPTKNPAGGYYRNPTTTSNGKLHDLLSTMIAPTGADWPWWVCARKCAELKKCVYWALHERPTIKRKCALYEKEYASEGLVAGSTTKSTPALNSAGMSSDACIPDAAKCTGDTYYKDPVYTGSPWALASAASCEACPAGKAIKVGTRDNGHLERACIVTTTTTAATPTVIPVATTVKNAPTTAASTDPPAATSTPAPPKAKIVDNGVAGCKSYNQCTACMGDCDVDADCAGTLKCFLRKGATAWDTVPGCAATGTVQGHDYCYAHTPHAGDTDRAPDTGSPGETGDVNGGSAGTPTNPLWDWVNGTTVSVVTGVRQQWHRVTVDVQGPATSELASTNPFKDYRFDVVFRLQGSTPELSPWMQRQTASTAVVKVLGFWPDVCVFEIVSIVQYIWRSVVLI